MISMDIEKGLISNKSKSSIKLNPQCVLSSKLDFDGTPKDLNDIYDYLVSWCNDQASRGPSVRIQSESIPTVSTTNSDAALLQDDKSDQNNLSQPIISLTSPNFKKGTVEVHYEEITDEFSFAHNYVDFCIDSDTLYKSLLNDNGDRVKQTDPFFARVCSFFFTRNVMRIATILAIYNAVIEALKGTIASTETAGGYYGNAIGDICVLWLYGWGYYVYHGSYYKNILISDAERGMLIEEITKKIKGILLSEGELEQDDLKGLLEDAVELGASAADDITLTEALHFDFSRHEKSNMNSSQSNMTVLPDIGKIFFDPDVRNRLASKVGFYEMLDIAGKYLHQQRLYAKTKRNKIVENYIIIVGILTVLGVAAGWYTNLSVYLSCQSGSVLNTDAAGYSCSSSTFGMYFQLGYVLFFLNLTLNIWGIIATLSGLIKGSFICHSLVDSFMRRYKMLRKLKIPSFSDIKLTEFTNEEQIKIKFIETVASYLKRDCYERYIFIKTLMEQISQIWSGLLTGILIVSSILLIFYYTLILISGISSTYIAIVIITVKIFSTPTICCSYANSAMDLLFFKLKTSGPDDYSAIGGRDKFIEYATNTPCYWYIFGFAITPSWLAGFVGGTVSAVAASILISKFAP